MGGASGTCEVKAVRKTLALLAAASAALLLAVAAPAGAQPYTPGAGSLTLSTSSSPPGGPVTATGSGFAAGTTVTLTIASTPQTIGTTVANSGGGIQATVTIPSNIPAGGHTISATGLDPAGATLVLSAPITVTGAAAAPSSSGLAFTGTNALRFGGIALVLLLAGGGLVLVTRRRRVSSAD